MRITKTQLMQIIKEELSEVVVGASASRSVPPKVVLERAKAAFGKIDEMLKELVGDEKYENTLEADMDDIYNAFMQLEAYMKNQEASMNEAVKPIEDLISAALINANLPENTELDGYGVIGGGRIILVPKDAKLFAQNWRPTRTDVHSEYIVIVPEKVGSDTKTIQDQLQNMGLKQVRIHTGAGWME